MKYRVAWFLFLALGLASCRSPALYSPEVERQVIELARANVLAKFPDLDAASKAMIRTSRPDFGYYRMGGDYAQYSLSWLLTSNRQLVLSGQGNIRRLEGATCALREMAGQSVRFPVR
jgi:hypothetical protein